MRSTGAMALSATRPAGSTGSASRPSTQHTLALTDRVLSAAAEKGYTVTSCLDRPHRSQIVSFTTGSREADAAIVADLATKHVAVSLRGRGIRVSPYFYNTDDDVDRLIAELPWR